MKKSILFLFISFSLSIFSQNSKIVGNWIFEKITISQKTQEPFVPINFTEEGKIQIMGNDFGTWKLQGKTVILKTKSAEMSGEFTITFKNDFMILSSDKVSLSYINYQSIISEKTPFLGNRKQQNTNEDYYIRFSSPNKIVEVVLDNDGSISSSGTYLYLPKKDWIITYGSFEKIRRKNKLISFSKTNLVIKTDTDTLKFIKAPTVKPEILLFTYKDFDETANLENQLPWQDAYLLFKNMVKLKALIYNKSNYIPDIKAFNNEKYVQKINTNSQKQRIEIKNYIIVKDSVFIGNSSKDKLENRFNPFFPQKDLDVYRISGKETVTINQKNYVCTVVEGLNDNIRYSYWMIDALPGVFAKITQCNINEDNIVQSYIQLTLQKISNR